MDASKTTSSKRRIGNDCGNLYTIYYATESSAEETETFPPSQYGKALGMRGLRRRAAGPHDMYSCKGFADSQGFETLSFPSIWRTPFHVMYPCPAETSRYR